MAGAKTSGNQPEAETGLSSTRVSFCRQTGTSESLNVPRLGAGQTQKNKQVQQLQAKPSSSYHAFERGVRGRRFYQGTPTQGVPRLIIGDRSSSISSNQIQIRDQIGYHPILRYPGSRKNHNCISDPGVGRNTPEPLRRRDSASARCGE